MRNLGMKINLPKESTLNMFTSIAGLLLVAASSTSFSVESTVAVNETETRAITKVIAKAPSDIGFKALDGDSDGKISLKEAIKNPVLAEQFNKTDVNKDGAITAEEYAMFSSKVKKATAIN